MRPRTAFAPMILAVCLLVACGGGDEGVGYEIPDTPDGTIRTVSSALADNHPEVVWDALPASYRADIDQIKVQFAEKMDPELYDRIFGLMRRAVRILQDKKEYILSSSLVDIDPDERDSISQQWDATVESLETVLSSEISTLDGLRALEPRAFLADTGARFMEQVSALADEADDSEISFTDKLRGIQVETVDSSGDRATVRITAPGEDVETVEMVRVEERWVPAEMARDWAQDVAEAKEQLASMDEQKMAQVKVQATFALTIADAFLEQLAAVDSVEAFDTIVKGMFGNLMGAVQPDLPPSPQGMDD